MLIGRMLKDPALPMCQGPIPGRDDFAGVRSCVLCFEKSASFQGKGRSSCVLQALKEAAEVAQASIELNKAMS